MILADTVVIPLLPPVCSSVPALELLTFSMGFGLVEKVVYTLRVSKIQQMLTFLSFWFL